MDAAEGRPLNIVVCVKPVPDTRPRGGAAAIDAGRKTVNREGVTLVPNRNDRVALEAALRLRDQAGGGTLTAVLMGPPRAETVARECLAIGADEAWLVSDRALAGSDVLATARALAAAVRRRGEVDLVVTGMESSDGGTGQVGPTLATLLGLYHVAGATAIRLARSGPGGGEGVVRRPSPGALRLEVDVGEAGRADGEGSGGEGSGGEGSGGEGSGGEGSGGEGSGGERRGGKGSSGVPAMTLEAETPVLVAVARTACKPRATTMLGIVKGRSRPLVVLDCEALGLDPAQVGEKGSPTRVSRLLLYQAGKKAEMLAGGMEEQAQGLARLLREKGFLPPGGAAP